MAELLYLARPKDSDMDRVDKWADEFRDVMQHEKNWIVYDPLSAFVVGSDTEPDDKISNLNSTALQIASALVAYLPEARTAGTLMEIALAERMGIPVAWFGADCWADHWSLASKGIRRVDGVVEAVAYCLGNAASSSMRMHESGLLRVEKLHPAAQLPHKAFPDDAGFDLYVSEERTIQPDHWCDVPLGIAIQPPPGIWFRIVGRSSTFRNRRLHVIEGIIDEGYRGELFVGVHNMGEDEEEVKVGERIAQMLPHTGHYFLSPQWAPELSAHPRGRQGFGSTGS